MGYLRKITAFLLTAAIAITSVICCAVSASAATSAYDLMKTLRKNAPTSGSKLDSDISFNYAWEANDINFIISGLSSEKAAEIKELTDNGQTLSILFGTDSGFNLVFEGSHRMINFKQRGLDEEYHQPPISLVYFTSSGSSYKLVFKIELSTFYTLVSPIKETVANAKIAAFSLSAVSSSGERTYYGGKKFRYLPYATEKTARVDVSTLSVSIAKQKVYTGSKITPDVIMKNGTYQLRKGTDYTLSYKNNVKIGKATVIIKGRGVYKGTKKVTFSIIPQRPSFSDAYIKGSNIVLTWSAVEKIDSYYVYRSSDGGKTYSLIKKLKAGNTTCVTSMPSGGEYIFRLRAGKDVGGKTYYSLYSDITRSFSNK